MPKGNIILIPFPFTDLSGSKLRPALVVAETSLDLTLAFITTQLQWQEKTDLLIKPNSSNGIKRTSLIRLSKLATIDKALVIGKLGNLSATEVLELNIKLKTLFQIP
jgi:mRNA interferase MazF